MVKITNKGFTLVELAIVIVIIGLLVGGVLQGQELIKQAQVRNVLADFNEYDTAVNTFRAKYDNALPGDFSQGAAFGLDPGNMAETTGAQTDGDGDGDGLLEDAGGDDLDAYEGEALNFWLHLADAGLVKGTYAASADGCDVVAAACSSTPGNAFPDVPFGNGIIALTDAGGELYWISGVDSTVGALTSIAGDELLPEDAYALDIKVDDGVATTGSALAFSAITAALAFTAEAGGSAACHTSGVYNYTATSRQCSLRVRASS